MEKLNLFEMQEVVGGVTVKQYCKTLVMIMEDMGRRESFDEWRLADTFYQEHCVK